MSVNVLTLAEVQNLLATQYASQAAIPANTNPGSSLGAIFNADGVLFLVIQNEIVYVDQIARLSTIPSNPDGTPNPDVDSFWAPFNIPRLGATQAQGPCVCTLPSPALSQIIVPVGGQVQTNSGIIFTVIADASNPNFNAGLNGYPIAVNATSTTVTVQCTTSGTVGNIQAGQITSIYANMGAFSGTVTNSVPFTGSPAIPGVNVESDAAYKARGTLIVSSGRTGTMNAIVGAAISVETGMIASFGDRVNVDLTEHDAYFTLVVNQAGTGTGPSPSLIAAVVSAIEGGPNNVPPQVRSAGCSYQVIGPTLIPVNASATIAVLPGYISSSVIAAASAAYTAFVNGIGLSPQTLPTRCAQITAAAAVLSTPGVAYVDDFLLNGSTNDVIAPFANQVVAGTVSFTPA